MDVALFQSLPQSLHTTQRHPGILSGTPTPRAHVFFYLFLILLLLIVLLRFPLQLEGVPDSGALDLVGGAGGIRDRVDRGLYGSVNDHGRRCAERGGGPALLSCGCDGGGTLLDGSAGDECRAGG